MQLYFMRHGEAVPKEENSERPLSVRGRLEVNKIADFLHQSDSINLIFHSSKRRSEETAEIMCDKLKLKSKIEKLSCLEPEGDIKALLYAINNLNDKTLLVGHLPNLELLCNYLITGDINNPTLILYPGSIVCLKQTPINWSVEWVLDPLLFK